MKKFLLSKNDLRKLFANETGKRFNVEFVAYNDYVEFLENKILSSFQGQKEIITVNSVKFHKPIHFINWLIENEGKRLLDGFGREWKYEKYKFHFKDISKSEFTEGLKCLHLYNTVAVPL